MERLVVELFLQKKHHKKKYESQKKQALKKSCFLK